MTNWKDFVVYPDTPLRESISRIDESGLQAVLVLGEDGTLDGHKIVLSIRNTAPYTSSTPGVLAWIRSRSVKHVRRFSFESATQRDAFPAATGITDARLGVSYDRYPDLGVGRREPGTPPCPTASCDVSVCRAR